MREANPHLSAAMAKHLTIHGTMRMEDGSYVWKFDNFQRMHSPYEFSVADARELWNQIRCPVLLIRGEKSFARDPRGDNSATAFHDYRAASIPDAGHWVHHDQLQLFLDALLPFLRGEA